MRLLCPWVPAPHSIALHSDIFAQDALRDAPARPLCNLSKSLNLTRNLILNLLTAN